MIAIVDYGVGNLFSLKSSFKMIGQEVVVTSDARVLEESDKIILPGVGAFGDAIDKLRQAGLDKVVSGLVMGGKPLMGICLGMQLLFDGGYEHGFKSGLGLIPGFVKPISEIIPPELKVPQIGWNALKLTSPKSPLFKYIEDGDSVYFVHSFSARECENSVIANTEYGVDLCAAVGNGNIYGCQFHPEKSGNVGLNILRGFCELEGV